MKALTLWQPWATLIAIGAKTIETRSWSTNHRGPLAIHAAKTTAGFYTLPGDCEGTDEGGWRYGYIGNFQAGYCYRTTDEGKRGDTFLVRLEGAPLEMSLPLGAVVATANLVDCVPILAGDRCDRADQARLPYPRIETRADDGLFPDGWIDLYHPTHGAAIDPDDGLSIPEQAPYGDFTPGRYAWLLDDIEPLPEPIPARGAQGLWEWEA